MHSAHLSNTDQSQLKWACVQMRDETVRRGWENGLRDTSAGEPLHQPFHGLGSLYAHLSHLK